MPIACGSRLEVFAVSGVPLLRSGDDLPTLVLHALAGQRVELRDGDVVVLASKAVSRAEGRFVDLTTVVPSARAQEVGREIGKDPRVVHLVLSEASIVSRKARDVLVVRHRLGFVVANAAIDLSNARPVDAPETSGPWALLLPVDPDASAERIRALLAKETGAAVGVVVTDSFGRPFRLGTVGVAIGVAGLPALWDKRGEPDLFERRLEHTETALADQVAAAADLVAGQAAEGRALVIVRGLSFDVGTHGIGELLRPPNQDLYA
jgi:coenzyme F420-0:L-glutamate ligase / coenzyme F420-1:gamma-L-glutamate ligase